MTNYRYFGWSEDDDNFWKVGPAGVEITIDAGVRWLPSLFLDIVDLLGEDEEDLRTGILVEFEADLTTRKA